MGEIGNIEKIALLFIALLLLMLPFTFGYLLGFCKGSKKTSGRSH